MWQCAEKIPQKRDFRFDLLSVAATAEHNECNENYPKAVVAVKKIAKTVIIHKKSSCNIYVNQMGVASSVSILCGGLFCVNYFFDIPANKYPTAKVTMRSANEAITSIFVPMRAEAYIERVENIPFPSSPMITAASELSLPHIINTVCVIVVTMGNALPKTTAFHIFTSAFANKNPTYPVINSAAAVMSNPTRDTLNIGRMKNPLSTSMLIISMNSAAFATGQSESRYTSFLSFILFLLSDFHYAVEGERIDVNVAYLTEEVFARALVIGELTRMTFL